MMLFDMPIRKPQLKTTLLSMLIASSTLIPLWFLGLVKEELYLVVTFMFMAIVLSELSLTPAAGKKQGIVFFSTLLLFGSIYLYMS